MSNHTNDSDHPHDAADRHANDADSQSDQTSPAGVMLILNPRSERRLLRVGGSSSYLDAVIRVVGSPNRSQSERLPVHVALVIDRSGSMAGTKLPTAKRAALAVIDGLSEQDSAAVVVFDDTIDVLQAEAPVTALLKAHVAAELASIKERGSTALHEGWLVGCRAIAADSATPSVEQRAGVRRCFLLTDGQANVGLTASTDLMQAAAQVREVAHVSTSTFGIGDDYDEEVLGPMAEAGGGQFYHLSSSREIATTFVGELEQLLGTLVRDAHLEIKAPSGVEIELISAYEWQTGAHGTGGSGRWKAIVGDLVGNEERHVVMSINFPAAPATAPGEHTVQVRLSWEDESGRHHTSWQQCTFRYAESEAAYDAELRDETVLHYAAKHLSDRAQREAISARKSGDMRRARLASQTARSSLDRLTLGLDDEIVAGEMKSLLEMEDELASHTLDAGSLKERYYQSQLRARSKPDLRRQHSEDQNAGSQPPNDIPS